MRVRVGGETRTGRAVDLRETAFRPEDIATAIRGDGPDGLAVECPTPGPVHDRVGVVRHGLDLSVRGALAAAARTRGLRAPQDDELAAVRDELDALDTPEVDLADARRRAAEADGAEAEARERVATLRGRVRALREADADPGDAAADLREATRRLADVETERIAAEQSLGRARERARTARERRRERLRLRDRADNLRRAARVHLADAVRDEFERARQAVGGDDAVAAALAVLRVADLSAPAILACDRFERPGAAAAWLDAPVVRA